MDGEEYFHNNIEKSNEFPPTNAAPGLDAGCNSAQGNTGAHPGSTLGAGVALISESIFLTSLLPVPGRESTMNETFLPKNYCFWTKVQPQPAEQFRAGTDVR